MSRTDGLSVIIALLAVWVLGGFVLALTVGAVVRTADHREQLHRPAPAEPTGTCAPVTV